MWKGCKSFGIRVAEDAREGHRGKSKSKAIQRKGRDQEYGDRNNEKRPCEPDAKLASRQFATGCTGVGGIYFTICNTIECHRSRPCPKHRDGDPSYLPERRQTVSREYGPQKCEWK